MRRRDATDRPRSSSLPSGPSRGSSKRRGTAKETGAEVTRGLPPVFTSTEVASLFRVPRQRVERLVRAAKLEAYRLDGARGYRFLPEDLCRLLGVSEVKLAEMWGRVPRNGNGRTR